MSKAVEFEALGKRWQLRMSINALCHIEAATKLKFNAVVADLKEGSFLTTRLMFVAALGGKLPEDKVGDIIDDLGLEAAMDLLGQAIALAFPESAEAPESAPGN